VSATLSAIPEPQPAEPPTWEEIEAAADATLADIVVEEGTLEDFAAVVPDLADDVPEDERRADLRRALGPLAPEWAVELAVNDSAVFSGEAGELLRFAVTTAVFTDRADVLRRLAAYLLARGVDRFIALALLHGWATHFCAPAPFEGEVCAVVSEAWGAA
jgi:hypothetical protein